MIPPGCTARTWPYGTTKRGKVVWYRNGAQYVQELDNPSEMHILLFGAAAKMARVGEAITLTFTEGGPTGGHWQGTKDE